MLGDFLMNKKKRLLSVIMAVCVLFATMFAAVYGGSVLADENSSFFATKKTTIRLWYDDDALTDYLLQLSVTYNDTHKYTRLEPTLVSALEYLENISAASAAGEMYPDLYILTNDSLEKAYLAGLALPVTSDTLSDTQYPSAALKSVTYDGKYIAYPYYFETSTLLYNKTYLENAARDSLENEYYMENVEDPQQDADTQESDSASFEGSVEISDDQVEQRVDEMIPDTITDIIRFAETYNAPAEVEAVFKWDVSDIFYNYFFVGNYINIGGDAGDNSQFIDVYNEDAIRCMDLYQQLNQFFAIDSKGSSYEEIIQDFIGGKIVFTLATTDALDTIAKAQEAGECPYEYGVVTMPSLTDDIGTRTMSVTRCIVVNGYSEHSKEASEAAEYICGRYDDTLYEMTGKVSANKNVQHSESGIKGFMEAYEGSVPMPKMIATSNFWMQLEISFEEIWEGADPNETLRKVSSQVKTQVSGSEQTIEESPIDFTNDVTWTQAQEYYDEGMTE
jgi:maltose-binding protein MalE